MNTVSLLLEALSGKGEAEQMLDERLQGGAITPRSVPRSLSPRRACRSFWSRCWRCLKSTSDQRGGRTPGDQRAARGTARVTPGCRAEAT